ncbi:uncharacterized protein LOC116341638 [Contarinia nasturtii]|uniref:uncharacterized protein LOC116341638 n=1 Tax=Contarinia nasturtii TaxID=265458 RepID=UPI0012D47084|nr:uncharacterized protein LOC116341638 [Contarinia nasturtii]
MKTLWILTLALFLFEGFIIQCDGGNVIGIAKDPSANQSELPIELIEEILFRAGFKTTRKAAQAEMKISRGMLNKIFKEYIIMIEICPDGESKEIIEFDKKAERYIKIQSYGRLMRLFNHFGEHVRRIHIYYDYMNDNMRRDINKNIIKKCANQLTELAIFTLSFDIDDHIEQIWDEISNENGEIHFPEVKKFKYNGRIPRRSFDVNSIFPKLETLKLSGNVDNLSCLVHLRQLKELSLNSLSIQENAVVNIITNNKQITKLAIFSYNTIRTVRSIAENLKDLKTLNVRDAGTNFFVSTTNHVYNLTSVTSLSVFSDKIEQFYGNLSFDMPHLKNLELIGWNFDHRITNFINRFHVLETVYVHKLTTDNPISCIQPLIYVKEFSTVNFENSELSSLKVFFENFDKTASNLITLKLFYFNDSEYSRYEKTMNKINNHLKESMKPTWQISHGYGTTKPEGKSQLHFLMFKRDL